MTDFNVDLEQEDMVDYEHPIPERIEGLVVQLDTDVLCYHYANLDDSFAENLEALKEGILTKMIMCGASHVNSHTTAGTKNGREDAAMVKEYQCTRAKSKDPIKQARVKALRHAIGIWTTHEQVTPMTWVGIEADDGMGIMQREDPENSVIMTVDKDLSMIEGEHCHLETYKRTTVPADFGHIELQVKKRVSPTTGKTSTENKIVGYGKSFFWAQMLMGDTADTIPGLLKISGDDAEKYCPKKSPDKKRKPLACGVVTAWKCIETAKTELEIAIRVMQLYKNYYGDEYTFTTWRDDEITVSWRDMMYEQGHLLWMQRYPNDSFKDYIREMAANAIISK